MNPLPPGSSSPRTVDSEPLRPDDNDSETPWADFQSDQTRALSLSAYANRTDSLHHFRHSDEDDLANDDNEFSHTNTSRYDPMDTSADTDSESNNSTISDSSTATLDSDATIDDILFTGDRLTLVPPVSLDPRMDLESGMYVEGQVVHGFVSVNGCLVFNVDSNGRSRPLAGDLNDTENLEFQLQRHLTMPHRSARPPPWQPPPPFPTLSGADQTSSYSLEIPNFTTGDTDSSDDDDDTWIPLDRSFPSSYQVSPQSQNFATNTPTVTIPVIPSQSMENQTSREELEQQQLQQLQRRYPRTFNMAVSPIRQIAIPPESTLNRNGEEESSTLETGTQTRVTTSPLHSRSPATGLFLSLRNFRNTNTSSSETLGHLQPSMTVSPVRQFVIPPVSTLNRNGEEGSSYALDIGTQTRFTSSPLPSRSTVAVESDSISRAQRIQQIWNNSLEESNSRLELRSFNLDPISLSPPTRRRRHNDPEEALSDGVNNSERDADTIASSIVDQVLLDLGLSPSPTRIVNSPSILSSFSNYRRQPHTSAYLRNTATSLRTTSRFPRRTIASAPSHQSTARIQPTRTSTASITPISSLFSSRPSPIPANTTQDPWTHAVQTFAQSLQTGTTDQQESISLAISAFAAAAVGIPSSHTSSTDSSTSTSDDDDTFWPSTRPTRNPFRFHQPQLNTGNAFTDSINNIQVTVTRRLYRPSPNSPINPFNPTTQHTLSQTLLPPTVPTSSFSSTSSTTPLLSEQTHQTWEPHPHEDAITVQMPLCEYLLTRPLLDSNGTPIPTGASTATEGGVDTGTGFQHLDVGLVRAVRRGDADVCGFDVPGGGAELLLIGVDANGDPVSVGGGGGGGRGGVVCVDVEEAVYEGAGGSRGWAGEEEEDGVGVLAMTVTRGDVGVTEYPR